MAFVPPLADLAVDEDDGLNAVFQALVVGITGLDGMLVRPRWQRIPPPVPPIATNWCAIGALSSTPDAAPFIQHLDNEMTLTSGQDALQRHEEIPVIATFYGPAARSYAGRLRDGLAIEQNRWALTDLGFGVHEVGGITFVPELIGQEWRPRADLHLSFNRQLDRSYADGSVLFAPVDFNLS